MSKLKKAESKQDNEKLNKVIKAFALGISFLKILKTRLETKKKEEEKAFSQMNIGEKIQFILFFPFDWARKLTIPPSEEDNFDRKLLIAWPILGVIFIYFILTSPAYWWFSAIGVSALLCILFWKTSVDNELPKYYFFVEVLSVICGLLWTYLISSILIDLLQFLVVLSQLDATFMGLTIMAIGNALPDALTTIALAKQGFAIMGITGGYAGQLFGLLIGFGVAMLKQTIIDDKHYLVFDLFNPDNLRKNILDILVVFTSLSTLFTTFIFAVVKKFKMSKTFSVIGFSIYGLFAITAIVIAIYTVATH